MSLRTATENLGPGLQEKLQPRHQCQRAYIPFYWKSHSHEAKYTYIVIEDVELQRENLIELLHPPGSGIARQLRKRRGRLQLPRQWAQSRPDLIFLDAYRNAEIASGFNLLDAARNFCLSAKVIITTAFAEYAIKVMITTSPDTCSSP